MEIVIKIKCTLLSLGLQSNKRITKKRNYTTFPAPTHLLTDCVTIHNTIQLKTFSFVISAREGNIYIEEEGEKEEKHK